VDAAQARRATVSTAPPPPFALCFVLGLFLSLFLERLRGGPIRPYAAHP
jgi:hypothetical protein